MSVELTWENELPKSREGIGLIVYDLTNTLSYGNYDSLTLLYSFPDGQYTLEVEMYGDLDKIDYKIQVKGINSDMSYNFNNSFKLNDPIGHKKTSLYIKKTKRILSLKLLKGKCLAIKRARLKSNSFVRNRLSWKKQKDPKKQVRHLLKVSI